MYPDANYSGGIKKPLVLGSLLLSCKGLPHFRDGRRRKEEREAVFVCIDHISYI